MPHLFLLNFKLKTLEVVRRAVATRNSLTERQKPDAEGKSPTKSIRERARDGETYDDT